MCQTESFRRERDMLEEPGCAIRPAPQADSVSKPCIPEAAKSAKRCEMDSMGLDRCQKGDTYKGRGHTFG